MADDNQAGSVLRKECLRCGYSWWPRSTDAPKRCPKCTSPYWDRPRVRGASKKSDIQQQEEQRT